MHLSHSRLPRSGLFEQLGVARVGRHRSCPRSQCLPRPIQPLLQRPRLPPPQPTAACPQQVWHSVMEPHTLSDGDSLALLMYYFLTTLDKEVEHYSKRKFTLATLLYISNRYTPLVYSAYTAPWTLFSPGQKRMYLYIPLVIGCVHHFLNLDSCIAEWGIVIGLETLQYFPWAIFSALRTYALLRKIFWAVLVLVLSLTVVVVDLTRYRWAMIYEDPVHGCSLDNPVPMWFQHRCPALARGTAIIADIIVILVTWKTQYKTYGLSKDLPTPMRLCTIMLRDGTIYFVVLTILNIIVIVFEYLQIFTDNVTLDDNTSNLVIFVEPLTAILVSEFLNDLHEAADKTCGSETLSSVSALEFRIIGSISASLPAPTDDETPHEVVENSHEDPDGSEREAGQSREVVTSGAELEIEEAARGEAEA
ncbi:hypothetical protein GY45DRAFT_1360794 [Cubamyces sp. BRFM 1775]|nr:hypothetical protein GY45DRAFT_1360794 [Cubamyces sp. BRFM 1775]